MLITKHFIVGLALLFSFFSTPFAHAGDYAKTKYPIVLLHGYTGSKTLFGNDYFYGIVADLRENGATVFTPALSSINSTEVRGEQLRKYLKALKTTYKYPKFNLIGHSHGGLDARYVMGVEPDLVASVTTIGTPNHGAFVSDIALATGKFSQVFDSIYNLVGGTINLLDGVWLPQDKRAYLNSTSTVGVTAFNKRHPLGTVASCGTLASPEVAGNKEVYSFVALRPYPGFKFLAVNGGVDITNMWMYLQSVMAKDPKNDGWIDHCSQHFGKVIKDDLKWNHLDEVNQLNGRTPWDEVTPPMLYRTHANRLKNAGL